jgi:hypothetical protein
MTNNQSQPDNRRALITIRIFIVAAVVLIASAVAAVWFSIPGPDTKHVLVSPSGMRSIEMTELCTPMGCKRVTIADEIQPDGSHLRTGCLPQRAETTPLFNKVIATWSGSEESVTIDFTPAKGPAGTMTIVLSNCILTE